MSVRFTISAEGSSDEVLLPILRWTLGRYHPGVESEIYFDDFRLMGRQRDLRQRLRGSLARYPCDVLVVHRDSDGEDAEARAAEIRGAIELPSSCRYE